MSAGTPRETADAWKRRRSEKTEAIIADTLRAIALRGFDADDLGVTAAKLRRIMAGSTEAELDAILAKLVRR